MNWSASVVADVPPPVVATVTWTVPVPAGEVAEHDVEEVHETPVAAVSPNFTDPPARFEPLMVTAVPPTSGPLSGLMEVTAGAGLYVNRSCDVRADGPPAVVVTVTSTIPVPAGEVAVHNDSEVHDTFDAATPPKVTDPPIRVDPWIVTGVPPASGPLLGLIEVIAGAWL